MARESSPIGFLSVRKHMKGDAAYYIDLPLAITLALDIRIDDRLAYYPLKNGGIGLLKETDAAKKIDADAWIEILEKRALAKRKRRGYDENYENVLQRKLRHEREVEELIGSTKTEGQRRMIEEQQRGLGRGFSGVIGDTHRNLRQLLDISKKKQDQRKAIEAMDKRQKEIREAEKLRKQQQKRAKRTSDEDEDDQD